MIFLKTAQRYVASQKWVTLLLIASFAGSTLLLLAVNQTVEAIDNAFSRRASSTPLVIGRRGSRFELALHSLYYRNPGSQSIPFGQLEIAASNNNGICVPILFSHQVAIKHNPIIATTEAYFIARRLTLKHGKSPGRLGHCVIGAKLQQTQGINLGDFIQPQPKSAFDVTSPVPVELEVVGILKEASSPDDLAVFTTLETGWLLTGTGHGHDDGDDGTRANNAEATSHLPETPITRITDKNVDSFHFHGDRSQFPLSAILAFPENQQSQTVLEGKYLADEAPFQAIVPSLVIQEVMQSVYKVESILSVVSLLSLAFVILILIVLTVLSVRLRKQELDTLQMIGCSRITSLKLVGCETLLILAYSCIAIGLGYVGLALSGVLTASYWI